MTESRLNALSDVGGIRVGHHTAIGDGHLTGTTVVLAPPGGMIAGVDVRGGGPGTRETDLLAPTASVERVHAIVLTGGSAYGLASASGVAAALGRQGIGIRVGDGADEVVPIVPAAVVFDLGRGGQFHATPGAEFGASALRDAQTASQQDGAAMGVIGAGTGSLTGRLKGGIGQASAVLPNGSIVSALVVANATGVPFDPETGELSGARLFRPEDGPRPGPVNDAELLALQALSAEIGAGLAAASKSAAAAANPTPAAAAANPTPAAAAANPTPAAAAADPTPAAAAANPPHSQIPSTAQGFGSESISHTTLGVIATNATLTKAQCTKLAGMAHDGLARAVNPVHTMFDGDLFFGVSTAELPPPDPAELYHILSAAADVVTRAMVHAVLSAQTVTTPVATFRSYLDIAPSALRSGAVQQDAVEQADPA